MSHCYAIMQVRYNLHTPRILCLEGVDKTVDKYVRLDINYTLPNILILLTFI